VEIPVVRLNDSPPKLVAELGYPLYKEDVKENMRIYDLRT